MEKNIGGYKVAVQYDMNPESPREWDNLGTIYSNHRYYDPDGHSIEEAMNEYEDGLSKEFLAENIYLPVYGYEHGGMSISTGRGYPFNDRWDSGLFGIIAVSKYKIRKEYGCKRVSKNLREKVLDILRAEVETLDNYYNGQVYAFTVEDERGDIVESCCGYYSYEDCEQDAVLEAANLVKKEAERLEECMMLGIA